MGKYTERLHSECSDQPLNDNVNRPRWFIVALMLVVLATCTVGTYAWFVQVTTDIIGLEVDSHGLKLDAELYYSNTINPIDIAGSDFTLQQIDEQRIISNNSNFTAGCELLFRIEIKNCSNEFPYSTDLDVTAGQNAYISLSFNNLNAYFDEAVNNYSGSITSDINELISENSGVMMMKLNYIKYYKGTERPVSATNLIEYDITGKQSLVEDYGDGQYFFEYENLEPGQSLYVYFSIICMTPTEAASSYRAYRSLNVSEVPQDRRAAYTAIYEEELASLVIEKNDSSGTGSNATAVSRSLKFRIQYISVFATGNPGADTSAKVLSGTYSER